MTLMMIIIIAIIIRQTLRSNIWRAPVASAAAVAKRSRCKRQLQAEQSLTAAVEATAVTTSDAAITQKP